MNHKQILAALAGTIALAGGTVAIAQQPAATTTATPMKHNKAGGHMMRMSDANKDGTLTRAEATAAADARFAMLDADRNGTVTAAEMQASRDQMRAKMNEKRTAAGKAPREPRAAATNRPGRRLDTNGNQQVTRDEFRARALQRFDRFDANKDGQITQAEREANRGTMRGQRGQRGPMTQPTPTT